MVILVECCVSVDYKFGLKGLLTTRVEIFLQANFGE
jgi:hypothetical protein